MFNRRGFIVRAIAGLATSAVAACASKRPPVPPVLKACPSLEELSGGPRQVLPSSANRVVIEGCRTAISYPGFEYVLNHDPAEGPDLRHLTFIGELIVKADANVKASKCNPALCCNRMEIHGPRATNLPKQVARMRMTRHPRYGRVMQLEGTHPEA